MTAALIILAALVLVGAGLYIHHRLTYGGVSETPAEETKPGSVADADSQCCGLHLTCEKDSLLTAPGQEIVYFDDEELDLYKDRLPDAYTDAETEQFRDVLLTLLPSDIAGWARSLQLRGIALPSPVRDELLMIVAEARAVKGYS